MDKHKLRISQETLDMDLWISKLKDAAGYLTFHTRKDLYNLESLKKDLVSDTTFIQTAKQPSDSPPTGATKKSITLPQLVTQKAYRRKTKAQPSTLQKTKNVYQYVKKEIVKHPTTDATKPTDTFSTLKEINSSLKESPEVPGGGFKRITDTQSANLPCGEGPMNIIAQKEVKRLAESPGTPLLKKILQEGNTSKNIGKYDDFHKVGKKPSLKIPEQTPEGWKIKVKSNTKANDIQKDHDHKFYPLPLGIYHQKN
ncbi:uncharacterized protein MELLADRAFT_70155 [Melampsora larici-populina 98AG31]|uniref:Uncharacterized protein n=1 Tax=Melampsora larici-populina (strain 98AG31 / pathotype 3-4-7) TaxID=747676 RepID=F4SDU1_MELLP|nr:uncharacterized protein MELLADRAFT_70155 [Melampsora larici-populina 98AG31]EGF97186.1 hypothetical protein MELLADRAFT_70155 [Melampsora larici-populina 98AG31]